MKKIRIVIVSLFVLSFSNILGQSGGSEYSDTNIYQNAIIYLSSGEKIDCEILVYKKDTLHHTNKYKILINGEKEKVRFTKLDSIELGSSMYKKIFLSEEGGYGGSYEKVSKLGTQIMDGPVPIYISHWVDNTGYTMVIDKSAYMTYDFYYKMNGEFSKIYKPAMGFGEHSTIIKQLRKIFPNCPYLDIDKKERKVEYKDIPELLEKAKVECGAL